MYTSEEILQKVNTYLTRLSFTRQPASLYVPVQYVLSMGGKRIRPTLMLLAYNLYKEDVDSILVNAIALEIYHNYTLLHDDLMDHADMRRGKMTVHKKWNANTAILSGDSMLVLAYEQMAKCADVYLRPVLDLFTETALEIGEGQQYDIDFETRDDVTEDEYIEMIRLKTSVLLACALKIGAILADAPEADRDNLYRFGEQLGLTFQLQDDYLDVYGDPKIFGKVIGGDIISNKKTYMLINAFNKADKRQRKELDHWIQAKDFDREEKVAAITHLYNEMGIDQMALKKMDDFFKVSQHYLDAVDLPESRKQILAGFARNMMNRNH
ncbi:MAG: polyprenyl synthetase family protein [Prevotella sp.]|jgi:geranylgeranyl diphosphate synthase type II|uniref:Polyprenyl synthetase family protein n=1 Tax=Segatella cerevisiae TaxID=2053716 RepID=A0ABT1C0P4_9BACT|nr:polyprenyl synthetase family protein [Segatella cerevisiae]MCI1246583.1 polyprenyl synthetase family protein [Prevotella sp.]MCO6026043.1 polyprenyl synthetase family protein [Segatella cerevisiae]